MKLKEGHRVLGAELMNATPGYNKIYLQFNIYGNCIDNYIRKVTDILSIITFIYELPSGHEDVPKPSMDQIFFKKSLWSTNPPLLSFTIIRQTSASCFVLQMGVKSCDKASPVKTY